MDKKVLNASKGKIYTNGKAYGHTIELGVYDKADNWYEITESEYKQILAEQEEKHNG